MQDDIGPVYNFGRLAAIRARAARAAANPEDPEYEPEELPLSCAQKTGIAFCCSLLVMYFMTMLVVIPQLLRSGVKLPKPHQPGYNPLSNNTVVLEKDPYSETRSETWYWDLHTDFFLLMGVPFSVLGTLYCAKTWFVAGSSPTKSEHRH
mmetsp:Transcript_120398/g.239610  ORF Transcript_120398/g.239610 Transcript_120398/m.239610 type:complete len:150 (+) Transcript_120398:93-542(+)